MQPAYFLASKNDRSVAMSFIGFINMFMIGIQVGSVIFMPDVFKKPNLVFTFLTMTTSPSLLYHWLPCIRKNKCFIYLAKAFSSFICGLMVIAIALLIYEESELGKIVYAVAIAFFLAPAFLTSVTLMIILNTQSKRELFLQPVYLLTQPQHEVMV